MITYPKIKNIFLCDIESKPSKILTGQYTLPVFEYLRNNIWKATEKVDGMNVRIIYEPAEAELAFKGRTNQAQMPVQLLKHLNNTFNPLYKQIREIFDYEPVCFYGEGYGPKIQKGGKYRDDQNFVLFDIKIGKYWLPQDKIRSIAQILNIDQVPVVHQGTLPELVQFVRNGFKSTWGDFYAEGIVARPVIEMFNNYSERIILKIKHKDFINESK